MNYILSRRPDNSYKIKIIKNISLISFNNFKPSILGSASLKSSLYPSDFDLFSEVKYKNIEEAKTNITKQFRDIVKRLKGKKNIFFMDFKAGYDPELVQDFNSISEIKKFYLNKGRFLTLKEQKQIQNLNNLDDLKEYTRQLYTLRWTEKELLSGKKKLRGGREITLKDCILDKSTIKIDILSFIDNELVEFSNLFEFYAGTKPLNIERDSRVVSNLKKDIKVFWEDNKKMKALKRIFSVAVLKKRKGLVKKLSELFNSNLGILYQTINNFENIVQLLTDKKVQLATGDNINKLNSFIQILKDRLGNISQFKFPEKYFQQIDKITKLKNKKQKIQKLIKELKEILNKAVVEYLKKNKIKISNFI